MTFIGSVGFLIGSIGIYKKILTYSAIHTISVVENNAKKRYKNSCNPLLYDYTLPTTAYRQHPRFISRVGNMAKFNSTEEIERKYNQKIGNVKKRRTEALRNFANGVNKKKIDNQGQENTEKQRQKAMKLVQAYCVQRDTNKNKLGYCISCPKFTTLQGGHYIERSHRGTCCDRRNINGQCVGCNNKTRQSSDDMIRVRRDYTFAMIAKYGADVVRELYNARRVSSKVLSIQRQMIALQYTAGFPFPTEPRNFRQEGQELRKNGEIPQDILDEVGG